MIKISPKYLNFENISKKCICVPWPLGTKIDHQVNFDHQVKSFIRKQVTN